MKGLAEYQTVPFGNETFAFAIVVCFYVFPKLPIH